MKSCPTCKAIWQDRYCILLLLAAALLLRIDFLIASNFRIDADEAIVGLMGKHILETGHIPVFYYGQHYMGSLEALLTAGVFNLFEVSEVMLKIVPLIFSLLLVPLIYLLGLEIGDRCLARLGAFFAALPPSTLVIWSTKARGGFIEVVIIGALAFLLTCRWLKSDSISRMGLFLIGFVLGVGWWVNNQIIYFMLPIGFFILGRILQSGSKPLLSTVLRTFGIGFCSFLFGGFPFWFYNIENNFASFGMFGASQGEQILEHVAGIFNTALPIILGAKRYWENQDLFPFSTLLIYSVYGLLLLFILLARRKYIRELFLLRLNTKRPVEIFFLLIIGTLIVFALSSFGDLVRAPRYLLPLYAAVFPLIAWAVRLLAVQAPKAATVVAVLILAFNLYSYYPGKRAIPGEPFVFKQQRVSPDHEQLIAWLKEREIHWVRTNYWIGYRLAFETKEEIKFLIYGEPGQVRIDSYQKEGKEFGKEQMPLVLVPAQAEYVRTAFELRGYDYKSTPVSGYEILYDLKPRQKNLIRLEADKIRAEAFDLNEKIIQSADGKLAGAVDGDLTTRWGSGRPQSPGMRFELGLPSWPRIRAFSYELGRWKSDYPRSLRIEFELETGKRIELFPAEHYQALLYTLQGDTTLSFYFRPLRLRRVILYQDGSHPVLDWSIAELELYR